MVTEEVLSTFDTNYDGSINQGDYINSDHLDLVLEACDTDMDGTVNSCELFDCVVMVEN